MGEAGEDRDEHCDGGADDVGHGLGFTQPDAQIVTLWFCQYP
jgi:hypothetical protein